MKFCPLISTQEHKKEPSPSNCKDCYFYLYEPQSKSAYCAILLAAERSSNAAEILTKEQNGML